MSNANGRKAVLSSSTDSCSAESFERSVGDSKLSNVLDLDQCCGSLASGHLSELENRHICCVGMCVLDIIHVCANFPAEDTDKRCLAGHMQRGGNASNMCTVLRSLNCNNVEFLGMMSTAPGFEFLRNDCERRNIIYENCPTVLQNPPFSSVILVKNTDSRTIIHSNSNFPILKYVHFKKVNLSDYCWFHFEARNLAETLLMQRDIHVYNALTEGRGSADGDADGCTEPEPQQRRQRIIISVEFEKLIEENLILALGADYVFLSKELACHMGWHDPEKAVHGLRQWLELARKKPNIALWQQQMKPPTIICPWGALGTGALSEIDVYSFSAAETPEKIVDALGAGDTFCAATIFCLKKLDLPFEMAVELATIMAGLKLEQYGYDGLAAKINIAFEIFQNRKEARREARQRD